MAKNYMYLYGRNSVIERIKTHPDSVRRVSLREGLSIPELEELIQVKGIPSERLPSTALDKMRPQKDLQGVVARVDLYRYTEPDELIAEAVRDHRTLIFLDRVTDPHNLGVIIRLSACFGKFSVIIPSREACNVNETVLHVASGGENYVPIASVNNLAPILDDAKKEGFWVVGAVVGDEAEDITAVSFPLPLPWCWDPKAAASARASRAGSTSAPASPCRACRCRSTSVWRARFSSTRFRNN
jgi:23S rRNA (guanosine2251-2'-O)-methyltransferase